MNAKVFFHNVELIPERICYTMYISIHVTNDYFTSEQVKPTVTVMKRK